MIAVKKADGLQKQVRLANKCGIIKIESHALKRKQVTFMGKKESVNVQGTEISVLMHRQDDYISLTDMANIKMLKLRGL